MSPKLISPASGNLGAVLVKAEKANPWRSWSDGSRDWMVADYLAEIQEETLFRDAYYDGIGKIFLCRPEGYLESEPLLQATDLSIQERRKYNV